MRLVLQMFLQNNKKILFFILVFVVFLNATELQYRKPNNIGTHDTGLEQCKARGKNFSYNSGGITCKHSSPCISAVSGVTINSAPFNQMEKIKNEIEDTKKYMNKITKLQANKVINAISVQAQYNLLNVKLKQEVYEAKKSVDLQCLILDTSINDLNNKILLLENNIIKMANKK